MTALRRLALSLVFDVFEVERLAVDAARGRRDPAGDLAALGHRLHQAAHVLAIGDISQEAGGQITQHRSHQSGRDVDIGLVYKTKPASFPEDFVPATADNLDCEATYALVNEFAETANQDGGVQVIFLDYNVQGLLYQWAKEHGEDEAILGQLFEYPNHGGGDALVRHIPNHNNHLHVRFKCPGSDTSCRN